jgi:hypothetical protein
MTSDYFDHVERELRAAVRRHAHLPWYLRLRARHSRALVVALAALVIGGPALAAVGLLQSGSSVGPGAPLTPNAFNGVALRRSVQLLSLRVPDPDGGPPWGMRLIRTTRGLLCVQVGRVAFGAVGALGRDGAFGDDGRFHPFSPNYQQGPGYDCVTPDRRGNGFLDVAAQGMPASGLLGGRARDGGCVPAQSLPARGRAGRRAIGRRVRPRPGRLPTCAGRDLRDVFYGLLGPDAVTVTHVTASGAVAATPTSGPDGAYLIVLPDLGPMSQNGTGTSGSSPFAGAIRAVTYRNAPACHLPPLGPRVTVGQGSCPAIGYVPPAVHLPSPAEVASHVTASIERSKYYCEQGGGNTIVPCPTRVPTGFHRLDMSRGPAESLVQISWVSRVAISNGHSYYYVQMGRAPYTDPRYRPGEQCGGGAGDFGQTNSDYAAGQRIVFFMFEPLTCRGPVRGNVTLVITTGPTQPGPMGAVRGQSVGREVGHFGFTLP